ncbi:DUF6881 domain-containing protein [Nocardia heshunensis]
MTTSEFGDSGSGAPGFIRQQFLVGEIVREIVDWVADGWTDIDVLFSLIGRRVGVEVVVDGPGPVRANPTQLRIPDAVAELRDLMYVSGRGTWFSMHIAINSGGGVSTSFDYGKPNIEGDLGSALLDDLRFYPLESLADWMKEEFTGNPVGIGDLEAPAIAPENSHAVAGDHDDSDDIDRDSAAIQARGFVSDIPGVRYMKVSGESGNGGPVAVFSEILDTGQEWRRVELFRDGSSGLAAVSGRTERTRLHVGAMPLPREVANTPGLIADEICAEEFQTEWLAAGGW